MISPDVEELDFTGVWQVQGTTQHLSKEAHFKLETVGTIEEPRDVLMVSQWFQMNHSEIFQNMT